MYCLPLPNSSRTRSINSKTEKENCFCDNFVDQIVLLSRLLETIAGIYADNEKLRDLLKSSFSASPEKLTKEMFRRVIDSDLGITVRLVIVFRGLTMSMVRSNFDKGIGAAIKKLGGSKEDEEVTRK